MLHFALLGAGSVTPVVLINYGSVWMINYMVSLKHWHHHLETYKNANYQPYPRLTESETLGWSPAICVLPSSPGESDAH